MPEEHPLVSVIIPVHNGGRHLRAALESVFAQTYRPFEVIVVDDGSVDDGGVIAQSFPDVRYIHQGNQGVAAARNNGIEAAHGEFFAFLDQDDLWTAEKAPTAGCPSSDSSRYRLYADSAKILS